MGRQEPLPRKVNIPMMLSRLLAPVILAVSVFAAGCGSDICSGTNCVCPAGETCEFDACDSSTQSCNFSCSGEATCTGSCGANCQVACSGKSCTHTVGVGSSVNCGAGTCNITCTGQCTVAGSANLTCQGGTESPAGCI